MHGQPAPDSGMPRQHQHNRRLHNNEDRLYTLVHTCRENRLRLAMAKARPCCSGREATCSPLLQSPTWRSCSTLQDSTLVISQLATMDSKARCETALDKRSARAEEKGDFYSARDAAYWREAKWQLCQCEKSLRCRWQRLRWNAATPRQVSRVLTPP